MGNPAELRLALVCYGGVSLAVYMHGVTKELQSLIRAARAFDKASPENPENPFRAGNPPYGTEAAYFDALTDLAREGRRLSVSIDIIGGTSAGGINGIALSKGLALGASQQPLKKVWIDDGDIRKLLRAPSWLRLFPQTFIAATRQVVRFSSPTSPLRGELMSRLIMGALEEMDKATRESSLIPAGGSLELFVPATDLDGFDVLVPSGAGGASQRDRLNAQVFEFRFEQGEFGRILHPGSRLRRAGIGEFSRCIRTGQSGVIRKGDCASSSSFIPRYSITLIPTTSTRRRCISSTGECWTTPPSTWSSQRSVVGAPTPRYTGALRISSLIRVATCTPRPSRRSRQVGAGLRTL